jgi:cell division protein FtsB
MSSAVPSPTAAKRLTAGRTTGKHEVARGRTSQARLTARAAVLAMVALILLTLAVAPLRALIDQRSDLAKLEQQAEQLARECLGMVRPGETAFVMVPTRGAPPSPSC